MESPPPKAIDCWLNPSTGVSSYRPEFLVRVAREYFKRLVADLHAGLDPLTPVEFKQVLVASAA